MKELNENELKFIKDNSTLNKDKVEKPMISEKETFLKLLSVAFLSAKRNNEKDILNKIDSTSAKDVLKRYYEKCLKLSFENVLKNFSLSEEIIEEYIEDIPLDSIIIEQELSVDFLRNFKANLNWDLVSKFQKISEEMALEFKDVLNWEFITIYQDLSLDFLIKNKEKFKTSQLTINPLTAPNWLTITNADEWRIEIPNHVINIPFVHDQQYNTPIGEYTFTTSGVNNIFSVDSFGTCLTGVGLTGSLTGVSSNSSNLTSNTEPIELEKKHYDDNSLSNAISKWCNLINKSKKDEQGKSNLLN